MNKETKELNTVYLRDKGLTEQGVEQASAFLVQLYNVMAERLSAQPQPGSEIRMRNSGGIELNKTREAILREQIKDADKS